MQSTENFGGSMLCAKFKHTLVRSLEYPLPMKSESLLARLLAIHISVKAQINWVHSQISIIVHTLHTSSEPPDLHKLMWHKLHECTYHTHSEDEHDIFHTWHVWE